MFKALEKSLEGKSPLSEEQETLSRNADLKHAETILDAGDSVHSGPAELDQTIVSRLKPHSIEAEQFRILKNHILFPENGVAPKCIMITSKSPGEGKSFVAANLAVSIAQSIDEYVLLMDCDLRAPTIHERFGLGHVAGLSEYLTGVKPLSAILKKTSIGKLTILPAGNLPSNPSELISSEHMKRLIQEVKSRYDDRYVIIDSPPPYITSEAGALAKLVDAMVVVVKSGSTHKQDVQELIDTYGREKIIGVVMNFAKKNKRYGYKNYYKYVQK